MIAAITTDKAPINGLVKPFLDTIPINNAVEISCKMLLILFSSDTSVDGCFRQNTIKYVKQAVNSHSAPKPNKYIPRCSRNDFIFKVDIISTNNFLIPSIKLGTSSSATSSYGHSHELKYKNASEIIIITQ